MMLNLKLLAMAAACAQAFLAPVPRPARGTPRLAAAVAAPPAPEVVRFGLDDDGDTGAIDVPISAEGVVPSALVPGVGSDPSLPADTPVVLLGAPADGRRDALAAAAARALRAPLVAARDALSLIHI